MDVCVEYRNGFVRSFAHQLTSLVQATHDVEGIERETSSVVQTSTEHAAQRLCPYCSMLLFFVIAYQVLFSATK